MLMNDSRVRKAARNSWGESRLRETDWSSVRQCHGNGVSFDSSSRMCPGHSKKPVMSLLLHLFTSGHQILGGKHVYRRCYRRWFVFPPHKAKWVSGLWLLQVCRCTECRCMRKWGKCLSIRVFFKFLKVPVGYVACRDGTSSSTRHLWKQEGASRKGLTLYVWIQCVTQCHTVATAFLNICLLKNPADTFMFVYVWSHAKFTCTTWQTNAGICSGPLPNLKKKKNRHHFNCFSKSEVLFLTAFNLFLILCRSLACCLVFSVSMVTGRLMLIPVQHFKMSKNPRCKHRGDAFCILLLDILVIGFSCLSRRWAGTSSSLGVKREWPTDVWQGGVGGQPVR